MSKKIVPFNSKAARKPVNKPMNPQLTVDVKNPELLTKIAQWRAAKTPENLNHILRGLGDVRVLVPAQVQQVQDKMIPVPIVYANPKGDHFLWAYTDRSQIKNDDVNKQMAIVNMSFGNLCGLALAEGTRIQGIAINPKTEGITLAIPAMQAVAEKREMEIPAAAQQPADPQMTLEVKNDSFEKALSDYKEAPSPDKLTMILQEVPDVRILVPIVLQEKDGKQVPIPFHFPAEEHRVLIPVFTSKQHLNPEMKRPIINMPLMDLIQAAAKEAEGNPDFFGLLFNPESLGIRFSPEMLKVLAAGGQVQKVNMNEQQYAAFEQVQFSNVFLPNRVFEGGQAVIDEMLSRKEEYLDELFEESYREKKMYPYLPEDFSMMPLGLGDGMEVIQIDFPEQDQMINSCVTAYIVWNSNTKLGRYFAIANAADGKKILVEIDREGMRTEIGDAPADGNEIYTILEYMKKQ